MNRETNMLKQNALILCRDIYRQELPPELSHMDKMDIAYADIAFENDYEQLFPWAFDMMKTLFDGYTTCNLFQNHSIKKLTVKEKKQRDKLIQKISYYYANIGFGEAYKRFLEAHDLLTEQVFVNEYNISTVTDGLDIPLMKAYFHFPEIVDFFWPELYGFRKEFILPPITNEQELNGFLAQGKHDLYVHFYNYHATFEIYYRKELYTSENLIERIQPICEKHQKSLTVNL